LSGLNYVIGILEEPFINELTDKLRCFLYEQTTDDVSGVEGIRIAQSDDASCAELKNIEEVGARNIKMTTGKWKFHFSPEVDYFRMRPANYPFSISISMCIGVHSIIHFFVGKVVTKLSLCTLASGEN
jgi:hypothetical protein